MLYFVLVFVYSIVLNILFAAVGIDPAMWSLAWWVMILGITALSATAAVLTENFIKGR